MSSTRMTCSTLRANIYQILDRVLKTGIPVEIERNGKILKIVPETPPARIENLPKRDYIRGDPEDLVHTDWSAEWRP